MTTTTHSPVRKRSLAAFTLVEIMVAAGLGAIVMTAIMTAFVFMGRAGVSLQQYTDLESQARTAIETFAQDVRIASGIVWNSQNSLTLTTAASSGGMEVTYTYNNGTGSLTRQIVAPVAAAGNAETLITGITSFQFTAYSISTGTVPLTQNDGSALASYTSANSNTKQVQISLRAERTNTSLATATNKVISARFILRNKRVTA